MRAMTVFCPLAILWLGVLPTVRLDAADPVFREVQRFSAAEAHQAVAVDRGAFYAITNRAVAKYDRADGTLVKRWQDSAKKPLRHLNSGAVIGDRLYCAHSTWPNSPLVNTLEIWDTTSLRHVRTISFPETEGAINWVDRRADAWWVVFAFYGEESVRKTRLVRYDDEWHETGQWRFPEPVNQRFLPNSNSGGSFAADGRLFVTGHDHGEVYVLRVPERPVAAEAGVAAKPGVAAEAGVAAELEYVETIAAPVTGQGIAWDRSEADGLLFGIRRTDRVVVALRLAR